MNSKIMINQRATDEQVKEFIDNGALYSDRTYNIDALVSMGFKSMKNNIHGYAKRYDLEVKKDIMGRSSLTGAMIAIRLRKKTGLSD